MMSPGLNVPVAMCLRDVHKDKEGSNKATGMLLEKEAISFLVSLVFCCLFFKTGSHYATLLTWSSLGRPHQTWRSTSLCLQSAGNECMSQHCPGQGTYLTWRIGVKNSKQKKVRMWKCGIVKQSSMNLKKSLLLSALFWVWYVDL